MTTTEPIQTREEWLAERKSGIGGSDSYGVCGLVDEFSRPYFGKTPYSVWADKMGHTEDSEETDYMARGCRAEGWLAEEYEHITGRKTRSEYKIRRHKDHPFLIASLDRIVTPEFGRERRLLEIKTSGRFDWWGPSGSGAAGVPEPYLFQVQHYLGVTGYDVADIIVALSIQDIRVYEVEPDARFIAKLQEREIKFWRDHVETGIAPETMSGDWVIAYPVDDGTRVPVVDPDERKDVESYLRLRGLKKELQGRLDALEDRIKGWIGRHRYLTMDDQVIVDWRTDQPKGKKIDLRKVQEKAPELFERLEKDFGTFPRPKRVFTVKRIKGDDGDE